MQGSAAHLERAIQFDLHLLFWASDLPRVLAAEPVIRLLELPAILDRLFEDAVLVTQPIAHRRELQCGHRVQEAGRQPSESTVAQSGVRLLLEYSGPIDAGIPN